MADLEPGVPAPAFTLARDDGGQVSLADFTGRKLVLYFYPKADTPGCTQESKDFTALQKAFAATGTDIIGVSPDPVRAQAKFKSKYDLGFALGSDESHEMLEAYGVWAQKSMYGRSYMGVERTTFLIGPQGQIVRVWRKVKVPGHAEEVLEAAKAL